MTEDRLLDKAALRKWLSCDYMTRGTFENFLSQLYREEGFPRPSELTQRRKRWKQSELDAWWDSRPKSDASRSPNKKRKRLLPRQRLEALLAANPKLTVICAECFTKKR